MYSRIALIVPDQIPFPARKRLIILLLLPTSKPKDRSDMPTCLQNSVISRNNSCSIGVGFLILFINVIMEVFLPCSQEVFLQAVKLFF